MLYLLKRKFPILVGMLVLLSATSFIHGDDQQFSTSFDEQCCEPACCEPCHEFIVNADFLYWRALQNGLECGCGPEIKDRWSPGFRVGLEYGTSSIDGSFAVLYTHLYNHYDHKNGSGSGDHANWKLKYDTIDLLYKYEFHSSSCFSYTPFIGLRGARIDQKLKARFDGCHCRNSSSSCGSFSDFEDASRFHQHHKEKLYGIGPEIGVVAYWDLGCDFSLYGSLGGGFLYGNFRVNVRDFEEIESPTDDGHFCVKRNINACQAFGDVAIGIQWERIFCDNMEAIARLGLEHHRYFNQNHIGGYGDLCLDGVVLSLGLRY